MSTSYCEVGDLLTGRVPLPAHLDQQKFVDDAAEEIDSKLGTRYVTPIVFDAVNPETRPSRLALKRINAHIASGRITLAGAAGGEDTELHAYGIHLLREGLDALNMLAAGNPPLVGAEPSNGGGTTPQGALPVVSNADPYSQVEAFYDILTPGRTSVAPEGFMPLRGPYPGIRHG